MDNFEKFNNIVEIFDTKEIGKLLSFGVDYEELRDGVGTFSTAIVVMKNGNVKNIPVENIKFIEVK